MRINKYNKPKNSTSGSGRATVTFVGGSISGTGGVCDEARKLLETHLIYGLPFNGTLDVDGELTTSGSITADGDISTKASVNANTVNADSVNASTVDADNIVADTGSINALSGTTLKYTNAEIKLAIIDTLTSIDITTENLTVTKLAHFFELIIDKIKAAGGAVLLTPADGFKVDLVKVVNESPKHYRLYWRATDGDRAISNMWKVGDLAICLTFNNAEVGANYNVSNKYYWSLVNAVGTETIEGVDYHFIEIEGSDATNNSANYDGVVNPEIGDNIAMLGYRGTDDENRQSAIYLAAYSSIDPTLKAPLICHYKGINDFDLKSHKFTWFASNGNEIRGNLKVESGKTVEEEITDTVIEVTNDIDLRVRANTSNITNNTNDIANLKILADNITSTVEEHTTNINALDGRVTSNTTNISTILLRADSIESRVTNILSTVNYDLNNPQNWRVGIRPTTYDIGTPFEDMYSNKSVSVVLYNHPIPYTLDTYISIKDGYLAYITYFDYEKKFLKQYEGWLSGDNIKLNEVDGAGYIGLAISEKSLEGVSFKPIMTLEDGVKAGVVISDTKITQSLIKLTADLILLKVDEVALSINDKKIVLDGDTEINGSLTMDNTDLGFILKGDSGITLITPLSIGDYSSFSDKATTTIPIAWTNTKSLLANATINLINSYSLGSIPANTLISLKNGWVRTNGVEYYSPITTKDILYKLKKDGVTIKSYNAGLMRTSPNILEFTTTLAGTYSVEIDYNITTTLTDTATFTAGMDVILPTGCFSLIGYDGMAMNFGNLKTVYFGSEATYISYGNKRIKVDANGIYKYGGIVSQYPQMMSLGAGTDSAYSIYITEYAPLNGCVVRSITSYGTTYLLPNDEFVVFSNVTGEVILLLPTPGSNIGRLIYIKKVMEGGTATLKGVMMPSNSIKEITTYSVGANSLTLISDGTHWILF